MEHITREEYFKLLQKQPKYHNHVVTNGFGNVQNHSKAEARFAGELYLLQKGGVYKSVQEQVKELLYVNKKCVGTVIVDFYVLHPDNTGEYIEYKSPATMTDLWKLKWKMLQAQYPKRKFTVIVQ